MKSKLIEIAKCRDRGGGRGEAEAVSPARGGGGASCRISAVSPEAAQLRCVCSLVWSQPAGGLELVIVDTIT